jgi:hypothetical protein
MPIGLGGYDNKARQLEQPHCDAGTNKAKNRQKHNRAYDSSKPPAQQVRSIK